MQNVHVSILASMTGEKIQRYGLLALRTSNLVHFWLPSRGVVECVCCGQRFQCVFFNIFKYRPCKKASDFVIANTERRALNEFN